MAEKVDRLVTHFGMLFEDHLERVGRALELGQSGAYDANDLARDWGETLSDSMSAMTVAWGIVLPSPDVCTIRVDKGTTEVEKKFRVTAKIEHGIQTDGLFKLAGKADVAYSATETTDHMAVKIAIASTAGLETAATGAPYIGNVFRKKSDGTKGEILLKLRLRVR